jgi:hypothetical protein
VEAITSLSFVWIQKYISNLADKVVLKDVVVRQDRIDVSKRNCEIRFLRHSYKVSNYNPFGVAIIHSEGADISDNVAAATFYIEGVEACSLNLKKIRTEKLEDGNFLTAFEVEGGPLHLGHVSAMLLSSDVVSRQRRYLETVNEIPEIFRSKIYELKEWLSNIEQEVNALQRHAPRTGMHDIIEFENGVCKVVGEFLGKSLPSMYDALIWALGNASPSQTALSLKFFREKMNGILYQAPFANRSYVKPLGYAGDYEVMNLIYRDQQEGDTLFAKCLHRYFINQPAAKAVRNRVQYLLPKVYEILNRYKSKNKVIKMLSVASGPAVELQTLLRDSRIGDELDLEISLLDQDLESLKHAQGRLRALSRKSKIKINYINRSIKTVIMRGLDNINYDLVYALGVFDYLSNPVAFATAKRLYEALEPGGTLIIGNFDIKNPTRTTMELALDWNLIHRSEEELYNLFSPISPEIKIEREKEAVNLFCVISKPKLAPQH